MNIVTRGSLYYSVLILTSNKEHNLNFVLFLSESLSGKLNSSKAIKQAPTTANYLAIRHRSWDSYFVETNNLSLHQIVFPDLRSYKRQIAKRWQQN